MNSDVSMNLPLDHPWAQEILRHRPSDYENQSEMHWPWGTMNFSDIECVIQLVAISEIHYGHSMHVDYITTHWKVWPRISPPESRDSTGLGPQG